MVENGRQNIQKNIRKNIQKTVEFFSAYLISLVMGFGKKYIYTRVFVLTPPLLKTPLDFFGNSVDNKNSARSAGEKIVDNKSAREAHEKNQGF